MKTALKTMILVVVGAGLAGLSSGCATDRAVVQQAEEFNGTLDKAVIHDPQLESYFQRLGTRIIAGAKAYDAEASQKQENKGIFSKEMEFPLVKKKPLNPSPPGGDQMYI